MLENTIKNNNLNLVLEKGKFNFTNKEDLANQIAAFKKLPRDYVEKTFEKKYEEGFLPLEPIINSENYSLYEDIKKKKEEIKFKKKTSYIDLNNLIGDKAFAAFINNDGEIIVKGFLYKFTPRGLFFGKLTDSSKIRDVSLKNYKASRRVEICDLRRNEGGIREVERGVQRFIAPIKKHEPCENVGGGSSGGSSSGGSSSSGVSTLDAKKIRSWIEKFSTRITNCNES